MAKRISTVKATYKPINTSELKPVADIYVKLVEPAAVLALFTAADPGIDATWVTNFKASITAVEKIVPSKTIAKKNKDTTNAIKLNSKNCVKYGKTLSYWLEKAFAGQTGLIESFGVVAANDKMRLGETEGLLFDLKNIVDQITANKTALVAAGWPVSNLTDYDGLYATVSSLNTQQELNKKLIPENTDAATLLRNSCYSYIQTLITVKDMVYYEDLTKRHEWAVSTNLNQIRGGKGGGNSTPPVV